MSPVLTGGSFPKDYLRRLIMDSTTKMTKLMRSFLLCIVFCIAAGNVMAGPIAEPTKTEAQLKLEEKAREKKKIKEKEKAAAKAKQQEAKRKKKAAQKAEREEKARIKREEKIRKAEMLKDKREAAEKAKREERARKAEILKAKREAAAKAKLQKEENAEFARLDAEVKKQTKAKIALAKKTRKRRLAELNVTANKQAQLAAKAKKQAKDIDTEKASLKRRLKEDKAKLASEHKQAKAKATKKEKAQLDAGYKSTVRQLKAEYEQALAELNKKANTQASEVARAKKQIKAEHVQLEIKAKKRTQEQAKQIKAEKANLKRKLNNDKSRLAAEYKKRKATPEAEYKEDIQQLDKEYKEAIATLDEKAGAQTDEITKKKQQIEDEYKETVAKINLKQKQQIEGRKVAKIALAEDKTLRLTVKDIRISGNMLITTAEILQDMPLIYNASDKPLHEAGSEYLYDFRAILDIIVEPGEAREVSTRTIQGLTQYILAIYQDKNYGGIYVYVPSEALLEGKLQDDILPIKVLEASVSKVAITHYDPENEVVEKGYLKDSAVDTWSPVKIGDVANRKKLDDFVNLLNLNPDRYVSAVVSKGVEPNSLAIGYNIYEANPWHYFIQADNSGTKTRQWNPRIGVINTNLLGIDDRFTAIYQAPWESGIEDNYSLYGSYDFPLLGPRLRLNLYGGHSEFDISPESSIFDFLGRGTFYGGVLRYNLLQENDWFLDIKGSLEHVRSRVNPSLFTTFLGTDIKFWLWGYGVDLHRSDDMSKTLLTFDRLESWGGESDAAEFSLARTGSKSDFSVYMALANHSQYIDLNKVQRISTTFKWIGSNERLVPAKMTSFGGMYSVRGYDEYEVVADGGMLASAQYEFDLVKYEESQMANQNSSEEPAGKLFLKKVAPLVFADYGRTTIRHPVSGLGEKKHVTMFSVGTGLILELGEHFTGVVYYGYPLRKTDNTRVGKGRVNVGLLLRW
jgi:hemolysin activation/secretion protein